MLLVLGVLAAFVVGGLVAFVIALPAAFIAMLILGSLHADIAAVPALGFWTTLKILWLVSIVGAFWKSETVKVDK